MFIGDNRKFNWTSYVEYFAKMDVPTSDHGYYAVLEMNGCEVYRWKLNRLDMLMVFNDRNLDQFEEDQRLYREVDENGLDQFVASRISDIFGQGRL